MFDAFYTRGLFVQTSVVHIVTTKCHFSTNYSSDMNKYRTKTAYTPTAICLVKSESAKMRLLARTKEVKRNYTEVKITEDKTWRRKQEVEEE